MRFLRCCLLPPAAHQVFLLLLAWNKFVWGLSSPEPATPKPVERVAVVGAGVAGLAVAHALTNSVDRPALDQVRVYDSRPGLDAAVGAGIQLNGGLSVLGLIRPGLRRAVCGAGVPVAEIESRCKPWTVEAADVSDESDLIKRFDLLQTVQRRGGETADKLLSSDDQPLLWTAIMRGALQQALYETLPNPQDHVQFGKKLVRIESENDVCYCHFADGSRTGPFDVVVGCDGINSVVKQYVDQGERLVEKGVDADTSAPSALYSGLRIRYAVSDGDPGQPAQTAAALKQYFGNGAYALHGTYGAGSNRPSTQCSFIVYLDDNYVGPFQKRDRPRTDKTVLEGENADWSQDVRQTVEVSRRGMLDQLAACGIPHSPESDLGRTIRQADRFFELGSYFHNPFCRWSRQLGEEGPCLVLCGDSAHALPPFLGQGSNQAIQDAYSLAERIHQYNAHTLAGDFAKKSTDNDDEEGKDGAPSSLKEWLKDYETRRWPSTFDIFWKSVVLGYLETGGPGGLYGKFRDAFIKTLGIIGFSEYVLLKAATPKT